MFHGVPPMLCSCAPPVFHFLPDPPSSSAIFRKFGAFAIDVHLELWPQQSLLSPSTSYESALMADCCGEKLLWLRLGAVLNEYKHKGLEGNCLLAKQ